MAKPFYPYVKPGSYKANPRKGYIPFVGRGGYTKQNHVWPPEPDPIWETVKGNPVSFETIKQWPLKQLSVAFSPVQTGTGDPSPDNVRPISGWDSLNVEQRGKNLLQLTGRRVVTNVSGTTRDFSEPSLYIGEAPNNYHDSFRVDSYSITENSVTMNMRVTSGYGLGFTVKVKPNTTYTVDYDDHVPNSICFGYYDEDGNYLGFMQYHKTITTPEKCTNLMVVLRTFDTGVDVTFNNPRMQFGETVDAFVPYNPLSRSISISFGSTVYSGTLDVLTGVVTVTMISQDMGTLNWSYSTSAKCFTVGTAGGLSAFANGQSATEGCLAFCSSYKRLKSGTGSSFSNNDKCFSFNKNASGGGINGNVGAMLLLVKDTAYDNKDTFKAAMSGVQIVYELLDPLTYQLTPQEVESLAGDNVVWSTANEDLTVEYRSN